MCLHGWLDNCCSFDGLAPKLPNDSHNFLAIDLIGKDNKVKKVIAKPHFSFLGHGFSTHYPPGMTYRFSDAITVTRYVKEHMEWDKFSIIGHSLGAAIGVWYSSVFNEEVDRLITLDLLNVAPLTLEKHIKKTKTAILSGVKTFKKLSSQEVPTYDYIDAVARAYMANNLAHGEEAITQNSVEILMKRGLRPVGDKFTWTADLRLRVPAAFHVLEEQVEHYSSNIKCPMMLLKATNSSWYMQDEVAKRLIKVYKNNNPNFEMHKIEGGHHVHLNNPERVSDLINGFLAKTDFKSEDEKLEKQHHFPHDLF